MPSYDSYDNPNREMYTFPAAAGYGSGTLAKTLQGPPGRKGLVRDILLTVTTAMVGTTSVPEVRVGTASSDNSFARWLLGTNATTGIGTGVYRARSLCQNAQGRTGEKPMQLVDFANHIFLEGNNASGTASIPGTTSTFTFLPADTAFFMTQVIGVGTPAGVADTYVIIEWF